MASEGFQTLNELFLKAVDKYDKPTCFLSKAAGRYQGISSREALAQVATLASALAQLGVGRGDRVAILSENRLEWAVTDYAILGRGAITVPVYPTLLEPDIDYILRDSGSKGIVVSSESQLQKVLKIRHALPDLRFVIVMDRVVPTGSECLSWWGTIEAEMKRGEDRVGAFRSASVGVRPEDTASLIYTSGTTGRPKGVVLTHANLASNILSCQNLFQLDHNDIGMSFLPLCHVFERMIDYLYFWLGVSIAYAEGFEALPQNLREVRPTVMAVVPRVLEKIHSKVMETVRQSSAVKQKLFAWALAVGRRSYPYRLDGRPLPFGLRLKHTLADALVFAKIRIQLGGQVSVMISGAAPLSRELADFLHAVGLPLYEGYGLTETSPVISVNYPGHTKLGTVGPVIPGVEVRIDEAVEDQEGGSGGEILVRGPNVTPGYHHLQEETRAAFVDGWFRTGDLGKLDSEGYLAITGRRKNLFKTSGGKYVSPEKLENLFQGHPYVHQIMVVGDARKFVAALVVPNFGRLFEYARDKGIHFNTREELVANPEIQTFVQQQVDDATRLFPPHEKIRQIALLPKEFSITSGELSATLKVKRRVVEERYRHLIEEMFRRHAPTAQPTSAATR